MRNATRFSLFALPLLIVGAFLLGRATRPVEASAATGGHVYSGVMGDSFRVPTAGTRCVVGEEAGAANVSCRHIPSAQARYSVVFYRDNLFVYRNGKPDDPVFSARGKP